MIPPQLTEDISRVRLRNKKEINIMTNVSKEGELTKDSSQLHQEKLQHPYGFEYTPLEDGRIQVSESERLRHTKTKNIMFSGEDDEGYPIMIENFTDCIINGGRFFQIDMFGNDEEVSSEELIEFIRNNYQW